MSSLEQIVLSLEQSRALVEKGIVLETAMVWFIRVNEAVTGDEYWWVGERSEICGTTIVPAPTLSELLDAIRAKVGDMDAECSFGIYKVDGTLQHGVAVDWVDAKDWEADRHKGAYSSTDLLAAAALLMEVSK